MFTCRRRDAMGMPLEIEGIEVGTSRLEPSGWVAAKAFDPKTDQELLDEDKIEAQKREERARKEGFFTREHGRRCSLLFLEAELGLSAWS